MASSANDPSYFRDTSDGPWQYVSENPDSSRHSYASVGMIPLQPGELMADPDRERPLSAPPPPGFGGGVEERQRMAGELLWGAGASSSRSWQYGGSALDPSGNAGNSNNSQQDDSLEGRSSMTDMHDFLGQGLVESMEDATTEMSPPIIGADGSVVLQQFGPPNGGDVSENKMRQIRHEAKKMLGVSPSHGSEGKLPKGSPPIGIYATSGTSAFQPKNGSPNGNAGGFPSGLSTPVRGYQGQGNGRNLPSRDVGNSIEEPLDSALSLLPNTVKSQPFNDNGGVGRYHLNAPSMKDLEDSMNKLSTAAPVFVPSTGGASGTASGHSSVSSSNGTTEMSGRQAEAELLPFLWETDSGRPSRSLALLHLSYVRQADVRSACEVFGVLDAFRAEFSSKGIYLVSFYDIRSAQYASVELQPMLQRLSVMQRSSEEVWVRYCTPLNSSSQFDESQIILSSVPSDVTESALNALLGTYGAIRTISREDEGSFKIEFQNSQDAKQALLELDSTQPWGPDVMVEMSARPVPERRRGRELLTMIGRWRQSVNRPSTSSVPDVSPKYPGSVDPWARKTESSSSGSPAVAHPPMDYGMTPNGYGAGPFGSGRPGALPPHQQPHQEGTTQFVLGPDGRYTQVFVPAPVMPYAPPGSTVIDPRTQQIVHGPNGQIYVTGNSFQGTPHGRHPPYNQYQQHPNMVSGMPYMENGPPRRAPPNFRTPHYTHDVAVDASSLSGRSYGSNRSNKEDDNRHLMLDLTAVESDRDTRTSLMVRHIPNKYTQQMLLSEFEEHGHGPGVIDFFYLPIDFKNRCNRGYAFINFVDYKDILSFHRRYYGKHWRTFNSDKICDITYARIQGKAAMLKRFENSALMEKDDEYKPLVFASEGSEKGKRLPFPAPGHKHH